MRNHQRALVALLVFCVAPLAAFHSSASSAEALPGQGVQPAAQGTNTARFQSIPVGVPAYPSTIYAPYNGVVGGTLSGASDVINAQGQMMVNQQQAYQMKEQYKQQKIVTRRQSLDESLYERAVMPTVEDDRERNRLENLRRARNNPNPTEIWSGTAINNVLLGIQQQIAQNVRTPDVPIPQGVIEHINVTAGQQNNNSLGMLRDGGKLSWPLALQADNFKTDREELDKYSYEAFKQVSGGPVDFKTINGMTKALDHLTNQLKDHISDMSPNDYVNAKRFLSRMYDTTSALQDPNATNYATRKLSAKGDSVMQFANEMSRQGLKVAPALGGDEPAYNALHRAMVTYLVYPEKPWDPKAK